MMKELKDILHELRCDIACIPITEENKKEIKQATKTLRKVWDLIHSTNIIVFPWGCMVELKLLSTEDPVTLRKEMKWSIKTETDYKEGFTYSEDAIRYFFGKQ